MREAVELRAFASALRHQVKAGQRTLRTLGQLLADFEERLEALDTAQPDEEAQRNGTRRSEVKIP
jgi:hypothetical protein